MWLYRFLALIGFVLAKTWRGSERIECGNSCVQGKESGMGGQSIWTLRVCSSISSRCTNERIVAIIYMVLGRTGDLRVGMLDRLNISHFGTAAVEVHIQSSRAAEGLRWSIMPAGTLSPKLFIALRI